MATSADDIDELAPVRVQRFAKGFERVLTRYLDGEIVVVGHGTSCALTLNARVASVSATAAMIRHGSGLIFVAMKQNRLAELRIPPMPADVASRCSGCHVAIDASDGIGTGISARDRGETLRRLANGESVPEDFRRPGHVVPVAGDLVVGGAAATPQIVLMLASLAEGASAVGAFTTLMSVERPCEVATPSEGVAIASRLGYRYVDGHMVRKAFYGYSWPSRPAGGLSSQTRGATVG
ncbi:MULTISPECIES: 3,4-dihydroxy-2-butanone-4-phosphate synthase [unclassified Mycolicibacterium]|uniref:3,4-dihydroxy-2-butanone-4-phosphate synthase n=1 Tax=unclassified Mycolicibacterium TaxID=2636767 RepID=UPI002ED892D3